MQYQNRTLASYSRAVLQFLFALLGILVIMAFVDDDGGLYPLRWILMGLFVLVVVVAFVGGLCEVSLQAEDDFVEISSQPVLNLKGHNHTWSINANRLIDYHYITLWPFFFIRVDYVGHNGMEKHAHAGLTLVNSSARKTLLKRLKEFKEGAPQRAKA